MDGLRHWIWLLFLGIGLVVAAAATAEPAETEPPNAALYRLYCASCHGPRADGGGPRAIRLDPSPADLTRLAVRYGRPLSRPQLLEQVTQRGRTSSGLRICGDRVFWRMSTVERRGVLLAVFDYLDSIQLDH